MITLINDDCLKAIDKYVIDNNLEHTKNFNINDI